MKNGKKAALHNLGCKVNAYETEAMQQMLEQAGYEIVPFAPGADVYVINTCTVTNMADRKSRQMLHKAKKMNPNAVIVAAGCYAQTATEKTGLAVEADLILGNNKKKDLIRELETLTEARQQVIDINHTNEYETLFISKTEEHTRAYMKVQDGCNQFCSYCMIPYARGRARSRKPEDVRKELLELTANGVKEIVLTGIHLSSYGKDLDTSLLELIRLTSEVEGVRRIRLGSLEPGIITEKFASELSEIPQICPHFHLSLQSGSDRVLKRMNRRYTSGEYLEKCGILRNYFDDPALTTDVIVGFPGETQEEFEETKAFLEKVNFYETHIFKYSKRQGTRAADMPDQIPEQVKTVRSEELIALNAVRKAAFEDAWCGKRVEVLCEEPVEIDGREYYTGYSKEYVKALVPADIPMDNEIVSGIFLKRKEEGVLLQRNEKSY